MFRIWKNVATPVLKVNDRYGQREIRPRQKNVSTCHHYSADWGPSDSWILLTLQVRVDLSSGARGQLLELIKPRLSLQGPWERIPAHQSTTQHKLTNRNNATVTFFHIEDAFQGELTATSRGSGVEQTTLQ